ncbi:hypothetical protein GOB83_13460 [Acetobacter fabarum]|uniref:glycosyltransferase family 9 protein n=1 Tax=Acetobacter fabarum TaxID=483199 RepID=UPI001404D59D|nr:hypothetical protein [Acetobacter fabarum]
MSEARPSTPQYSVNLDTDLSGVKLKRQQSYPNRSGSRLKHIVIRLRNLKARHSWQSLPLQIARHFFRITCIKIIGSGKAGKILSDFTELQPQRDIDALTFAILNKIKDGELGKLHAYAIYITGGIGDALICARMVRDLQKHIGNTLLFDIYCPSPEISESFFKNIPNFRQCINPYIFHNVKDCYIFSIIANQFATFVIEAIDYRSLLAYCPEVLNVFATAQQKRQKIERFIFNHPFLDGAFADIAVRTRHKRYNYLHEMLGLTYNGNELDIDIDSKIPLSFGLKPNTYITVHDGWDGNFKITTQRPTKAVPIEKWTQIISGLKQALPNLVIVQIGGPVGANLPGVNINLKKKLSFSESTSILAHSALHVDAETGLVHLATALGVKSVVMFGPTNVDWFGYPQNANIRPHQCGNCWWSTDTWMASCPLDLPIPACTNNINPDEVISAVVRLLKVSPTDTKPRVTA